MIVEIAFLRSTAGEIGFVPVSKSVPARLVVPLVSTTGTALNICRVFAAAAMIGTVGGEKQETVVVEGDHFALSRNAVELTVGLLRIERQFYGVDGLERFRQGVRADLIGINARDGAVRLTVAGGTVLQCGALQNCKQGLAIGCNRNDLQALVVAATGIGGIRRAEIDGAALVRRKGRARRDQALELTVGAE